MSAPTAVLRTGSSTRFRHVWATSCAYRHFPLTTMHPHSQLAAEAAEAAGTQGEFWAMHDALFENQQRLEAP